MSTGAANQPLHSSGANPDSSINASKPKVDPKWVRSYSDNLEPAHARRQPPLADHDVNRPG